MVKVWYTINRFLYFNLKINGSVRCGKYINYLYIILLS